MRKFFSLLTTVSSLLLLYACDPTPEPAASAAPSPAAPRPPDKVADGVVSEGVSYFRSDLVAYLRRPAHAEHDRRYWEIFSGSRGSVAGAFPGADPAGICPFKENGNQPMRNLAVAHAMQQAGLVRHAWYGLCVHDANPDVPPHWAEWGRLMASSEKAPVILASEVVAAGENAGLKEWAEWMRKRYLL